MVSRIETDVTTTQNAMSPLKSAYESDAMKAVRNGVQTLVDSLPGLLKALDEVAKLHPFIGSASLVTFLRVGRTRDVMAPLQSRSARSASSSSSTSSGATTTRKSACSSSRCGT